MWTGMRAPVFPGLGDDITVPTPSNPLDILQSMTADWDWHQWALAGIGSYLVVRTIFRAGRSGTQAVGKKVKKVKSGVKKRRKALKTVFTG
jgi:hypothetical protein